MTEKNPRLARLRQRTGTLIRQECGEQVENIRHRPDYTPDLEPFIQSLVHSLSPAGMIDAGPGNMIMTLCVQAPLELFHAAGCRPFRLTCGSHAAQNTAPLHLPALTCPMIKSTAGLLRQEDPPVFDGQKFVIPTTCDWVVKFSELTELYETAEIHFMALPRLRESQGASKQWLKEIHRFKQWLERTAGQKISAGALLESVNTYARAFALFSRLINLRRSQHIPSIHFTLIANALPYQDIEHWTACAADYIRHLREPGPHRLPVFLTGSPVAFPNYKLINLIEAAGMTVTADNFCSVERVFPGAAAYEDRSEYALLKALAQRHHTACTCPVFADNQRRINALIHTLEQGGIRGIIFHVLKGCHPFDMESGILENRLKQHGFRFLKIETDYVKEDEQAIVTRLEAFKRTLRSPP